ncbi:Cytochrome c-type biogenesis protein CcmD, interacts with CcmCE [hydrothermal vent metagenome]|uniref:Cytochrome c-type biogenesis protein CcmD n=1 Tax=hydrothermal vent metagenome TaxID=652676 RepID=A0A3B1B3F9_9ZZZZ
MSLNEFLNMGGYAAYVWSSYGITAVVLIWQVIGPIIQRKQIIKKLARKLKRQKVNI